MRCLLAIVMLFLLIAPAHAVEIDGRIDSAEWAGARNITDFRLIQPLSRAPAPQPTDAWVLATPEGLAVAFRNTQPASVLRTRQVAERDAGAPADRVTLIVDFDGDGRIGYNFVVLLSDSILDGTVTNENSFSTDWDGNWKHAVREDADAWSVEILIPWHIAPMSAGSDGQRVLGIQLARVIGATGERMAWPAVANVEPRFLSAFSKVSVPAYDSSLLAITPYVVGVFDNIHQRTEFDAGVDVFWKPNGRFQLSATVNPDFAQVESDELVVNFSAVETFFSDKRPFFTENQALFDVPFNGSERLIYTRRVGGQADDGSGAGNVSAAIKINGSAAGLNYGVFAATEADQVGRDFFALRSTRDVGKHGFGAMMTRVDRPYLERTADVYEFDHNWKPNAKLGVRSSLVVSDIDQSGVGTTDSGAQLRIDYDAGSWRHEFYAEHLGKDLQLNDFGYLQRNNFNYARYQLAHRVSNLPAGSGYASHDWRYQVATRHNDDGVNLATSIQAEVSSDLRDGGNEFARVAYHFPGHDDLITRNSDVLDVPAKLYAYYERFKPRKEHWSFYGSASYAAEGLAGPAHGALQVSLQPTYFINDNLSVYTELSAWHNPDWLLWQHDNLLASFSGDRLSLNAGVRWIVSSKQELRVKLETIAVDAKAHEAWRVAADGRPTQSADPVSDFSLRTMGFQIRYRYELGPLSNLYVAYVRGGLGLEEFSQGVLPLLGDSFSLRDNEQLLVKLNYRFEL